MYWINSNSAFFDNYIFKGSADMLALTVRLFRFFKSNSPVEIGLIPNDTVCLFIRGLEEYDARFGAAFNDGSWNNDFDHADTLGQIRCPVLLLHANHEILDDGTLNCAMSDEEANRAMSLLAEGSYKKISASHVVHLDKPGEFIKILRDFFLCMQ